MSDAFWIILILLLAGAANALVGCLLVLRRLSMLGDGISHSVLLGLVVAYLLVGSRDPLAMFVGAVTVGLLTAWGTNWLSRRIRVQHDASIGVVFTLFFAIAVILISAYAHRVHLDVEHVLYGEVAFAPFERLRLGGHDLGPQAIWILGGVLLVASAAIAAGFRAFQLLTFSGTLATLAGISVTFWHYLLMTLTSITAVASFQAVGAILVVALLVMPANTALRIARSLAGMMAWSVAFASTAVIGGYLLASHLDAAIAPAVVLIAGLQYFAVWALIPARPGPGLRSEE
ncbi:MAG: metal ABC transporter permease [Halothiobacillaceae bacterium]